MARMLCKALLQQPVLTRAHLLSLMTNQIAEDQRRRVRNERAFSMEEFEPALQLAVSKGWLVETEAGFRLTSKGQGFARHSRAGRTHNRGLEGSTLSAPNRPSQITRTAGGSRRAHFRLFPLLALRVVLFFPLGTVAAQAHI